VLIIVRHLTADGHIVCNGPSPCHRAEEPSTTSVNRWKRVDRGTRRGHSRPTWNLYQRKPNLTSSYFVPVIIFDLVLYMTSKWVSNCMVDIAVYVVKTVYIMDFMLLSNIFLIYLMKIFLTMT
jgi:hypothetical protein